MNCQKKVKESLVFMILLVLSLSFSSCNKDEEALAPEAPTDLKAEIVSNNQINLTWEDQSDFETGFALERSMTDNSNYELIAKLDSGVISYEDTNIPSANAIYFYRISALNGGSRSGYANEVEVSLPIPPPAERIIGRWSIARIEYSGGVSRDYVIAFDGCENGECKGLHEALSGPGSSLSYILTENGDNPPTLTINYDVERPQGDRGLKGNWELTTFTSDRIIMEGVYTITLIKFE